MSSRAHGEPTKTNREPPPPPILIPHDAAYLILARQGLVRASRQPLKHLLVVLALALLLGDRALQPLLQLLDRQLVRAHRVFGVRHLPLDVGRACLELPKRLGVLPLELGRFAAQRGLAAVRGDQLLLAIVHGVLQTVVAAAAA